MSTDVLVIVADGGSYIQHGKSQAVNAKRQGQWTSDVAWICNEATDMSDIEGRGINIVRVPETRCAMKWRLFDPRFRKWQRLMFFDTDSLIQRPLAQACDELSKRFPKILCDGTQDTTVWDDWVHFCRLGGAGEVADHQESFDRLKAKWPCVMGRLWGSSSFCFDPSSIPDGTVEAILAVQEEFKDINPGGFDQQVTGMVLNDQLERVTKDYFVWFAFDHITNRVASETRGWRGDEFPYVVHYWTCYAPWNEAKSPDCASSTNSRIGRNTLELYRENLAAFETEFPKL